MGKREEGVSGTGSAERQCGPCLLVPMSAAGETAGDGPGKLGWARVSSTLDITLRMLGFILKSNQKLPVAFKHKTT